MTSYVYQISSSATDGLYIGKANNLNNRWFEHLSDSKERLDYPLYRAFAKYGIDTFSIQEVRQFETEEEAFAYETQLIKELRAKGVKIYNQNDGGLGGVNPTPGLRKKISDNVKKTFATQESIDKRQSVFSSKSYKQNVSKAVSISWQCEEIAKKHSDGNRRAWADPEIRAKMIVAMNTPESKKRRRKAHIGVKRNPKVLTDQELMEAKQLRLQGISLNDIATKYGVSYHTVRKMLNSMVAK